MPLTDGETLRKTIRSKGLRATPARIKTLRLLHQTDYPMTHADVAKHLTTMGFDQATAYRDLNDLVESGMVRKTEVGDHVWRFELIESDKKKNHTHPHFLCLDCGDVSCLKDIKLPKDSLKSNVQIQKVTEILLRGYCRNCKLN